MKLSDSGLRGLSVSAFLLALLQAVCPAFVAINVVRVAVGLGALALAAGTGAAIRGYHQSLIRIPMMLLALLGASLNLFVIWHVRRLRARAAAQWRTVPVTPKKLRSERWQIGLALLTFAVLITESLSHWELHHHF